ncbi:hypothetical protein DJ030_01225 [bacterium endosymbiont of Escarpia laminata]|nr:MAG: hypothetical protein DJ030_01225 [bacterium endosymbiont of Escarpia laminata]
MLMGVSCWHQRGANMTEQLNTATENNDPSSPSMHPWGIIRLDANHQACINIMKRILSTVDYK